MPSVLDGNFLSSFSNNSFASSVVGSSEDLILIVCQFTRTGRIILGLGLIEVTRVYGRLHLVCRRFSIYNVGHVIKQYEGAPLPINICYRDRAPSISEFDG